MSFYRLYRRLRYGDPVVVVSGLPRSGTSMLMKMLEAGGVEIVQDGVRTADEDNPKGYYEHERVKNLGEEADRAWLRVARGKAIKIISHLLRQLPPDLNYKVLLVRRDIREVLASQAKMLDRRGEPNTADDEQMAELLEGDIWRASYLLRNASHFECLEVAYTSVLADARAEARRIAGFLGGGLDVERMAGVVDRQLYRNRAEDGSAV